MARSEATRPSIWNFSDGLPRPLRRPRNDKQLSSLAGARSVLLASRMAIQLDCFGARRLAMTGSGYTIFESALVVGVIKLVPLPSTLAGASQFIAPTTGAGTF